MERIAVTSGLVRFALATLALTGLLCVSPALAAPRMTASDRQAIGVLLDRFVKDVVLRRDLRAGWELAGPDLRGGTTRAAWLSGKGVTVQAFPARGTDFRNAWVGQLVAPGEAEGSMLLHAKRGHRGVDAIAFTVEVRKISGHWIVDIIYPAALFRFSSGHKGSCAKSSCAITGPADYRPQGASSGAGNSKGRISGRSFEIGLAAIGGLILLTPIAVWVRVKRRDRRAWAAYMSTRT
jgi:hypothetical protein